MQALQQEKPTQPSNFANYMVSLDAKHTQLLFGHRIEFEVIADILHRQFCRHLILRTTFNPYTSIAYLSSLLHYLQTHGMNKNAYSPFMYVLDNPAQLDDALLTHLRQPAKPKGNSLQFVVIKSISPNTNSNESAYEYLCSLLDSLPSHLRFLIFDANTTHGTNTPYNPFASILPAPFNQAEAIALVKFHLPSLLDFHQITITDDIINAAYTLAKRYLPQEEKIKQTLLLLDSALARMRRLSNSKENKTSSLSLPILHDVVASQIEMTAHKLERYQFDVEVFVKSMEHDVIGQDEAIHTLAARLQQVFTGIQFSPGPLLCLLLAGCRHTGKSTLASSLAKYLVEHHALYRVLKPYTHAKDMTEVRVIQHGTQHIASLREVITQKPYVLFLIEDVETLPTALAIGLEEILTTGYLHSPLQHVHLDFHQAGFILTTTLGAEKLAATQQHWQQENDTTNAQHSHALAQFINTSNETRAKFENNDDQAQMINELKQHYYGQLSTVIPFVPLTIAAVREIMHKKSSHLAEQLHLQYQVDFEIAPEVLRYLADKAIRSQQMDTGEINVEEIFKLVYHVVEKELAKAPSLTHLYLQLNESGDMLRCIKK